MYLRFKSLTAMEGKSGGNPFPNEKFLDWSKFKAFAGDKINIT